MRLFTVFVFLFLGLACQEDAPDSLKNAEESLRRSAEALQEARWDNAQYLEYLCGMKPNLRPLWEKSQAIHAHCNQLRKILLDYSRQLEATSLSPCEFFLQNGRKEHLQNAIAEHRAFIINAMEELQTAIEAQTLYGVRFRTGILDTLFERMPLARKDDFWRMRVSPDISQLSRADASALLQSLAIDAELSSLRVMFFLSDNIGIDNFWNEGWQLQAQATQAQAFLGEPFGVEIYASKEAKYMPLTTDMMYINAEPMREKFGAWEATVALRDTGWQDYVLTARLLLPNAKDSSTLQQKIRVFVTK